MATTVLIGVQWGDEGKGKIIDVITEDVDVVVRFQGGNNAGHTIEIGDEQFILHHIPSGIVRDGVQCIIGNGMVINPGDLLAEIVALEERGIDVRSRLQISSRAHLIMNYHMIMDSWREDAKDQRAIGTTRRGIGPAYADKAYRVGLRASDLLDLGRLEEKLREQIARYNGIFSSKDIATLDGDTEWAALRQTAEALAPMVSDTVISVNQAIKDGKKVLCEGAQGMGLDIDYGTYPYVTSSNTTSGAACTGAGIAPRRIDHVIGIAKAYTTRVGEGPFPTELDEVAGNALREAGREFGATTGRPRRCGWFDAVASRYSVMVNGVDNLAITKLDVLDDLDEIGICTGYRMNGDIVDHMPDNIDDLATVTAVVEMMPGWKTSTREADSWDALPEAASNYLNRLSELVEAPIGIVSIGPGREHTFFVDR